MANGRPSSKEANAFNRWLEKTYGAFKAIGIQLGFGSPWWEENPYYDSWVSQGKPGLVVVPLKEWQDLSPEEQDARKYDLSSEPFPAEDGYYWEKIKYDENGFPIKEQWGYFADEDTTGETPNWISDGQVVLEGRLVRMPDGTYVDYVNGMKVDTALAAKMLLEDSAGQDDNTLTEYQEGVLKQAVDDLKWEMEKYGTLSASDKASLQLAYDQLNQTRNEWLAGLKANPADWIEKWYAEHLPVGTQLGETYPWDAPVVGTSAWAQQKGLTSGEAAGMGVTHPVTSGGGTASPAASWDSTSWNSGVSQPSTQTGNPWANPNGTPNIGAINSWTGRTNPNAPPTSASLGTSWGYNMPSYQEYMNAHPNSSITPEAYYSQAGAYELAAYYNPAYAYGAQQAQIALQLGEITGTQYQQIKAANFVDARGNPLAPRTKSQAVSGQVAQGWADFESPQGYVGMLQAQGIPLSTWSDTLGPQASQAMRDYVNQYRTYLNTTDPNSPTWSAPAAPTDWGNYMGPNGGWVDYSGPGGGLGDMY